ncbi:fructosyl amino acid oxidasesarcosine oxidase [Colletotrichum godetiae]|uniref:Fructosyl amino acid oxidasesarcosine oxidase n=1 Tax=Colletotrichum godetiae TaxID=1209918 RepID=A0AAJ0EU06_9PEZI|nr:fructosyl amino acid oxidasesarcosine oxidase [Colletotrichum godetiae]KAK1673838.1 fructosyl amino acid oxidasesarcosine oxidase [Colletotrichum godetiae]
MAEPTVLIVGGGTFGTSTAYHLSRTYRDASRVTVVDRWAPSDPGGNKAAAIDVNRIIQTNYVRPLYCNLASEAIHPWFWDVNLGHFFHKTGCVTIDEENNQFSDAVRKTLKQRGSDYTTDADVEDLKKRWKPFQGLETSGLGTAFFNPEAGWCDAALATQNLMAAAKRNGVETIIGEVEELMFDSSLGRVLGVRMKDGRQLTADRIVLSAGAWTSHLLAPIEALLGLASCDRIERQITAVGRISAYYELSPEETKNMYEAGMPIVIYKSWGILTPPSRENRIMKINDLQTEFVNRVALSEGHVVSVPSGRGQEDVPQKLKTESQRLLNIMMPEFAQKKMPDRWRICWDAKTPTEDWLLCRHPRPQLENLFLAVGGNFDTYKFLPIAGKYMCNILKGKGNGREKDIAWGWKDEATLMNAKRRELGPKSRTSSLPEFRSFEETTRSSKL